MNEPNIDALWLATYDLQNLNIRKEVRCNGSYRKLNGYNLWVQLIFIFGCIQKK